ncbi:MAG: hypothetical protein F8N37_21005 [Telmatospirillum sp.]|nr:hypothetical protein [Telmatospirillum sp.]
MSFRTAFFAATTPLFIAIPSLAADSGNIASAQTETKSGTDAPIFTVNDNKLTFAYIFSGTDPGTFSVKQGGGYNGKTTKQTYQFSHFDGWKYGTNSLLISMYKSSHNDPASPCTQPGQLINGAKADCAGSTQIYGLWRSTFGLNEITGTRTFAIGPLRNLSLEIGGDASTQNTYFATDKRVFVGGLQFAFDLPYRGFFNVAPLYYKENNHKAFAQCGLFGPGNPGVSCLSDGNVRYHGTWAIETNYSMELDFLPDSMRFFSISGRAAWYGPKGDQNAPLPTRGVGPNSTATKTEFSSEPIRLTFDASKAFWGRDRSHFVDMWVAYRYWQNKFGLDHNASPGTCIVAGVNTKSCTESSLFSGVTVKF